MAASRRDALGDVIVRPMSRRHLRQALRIESLVYPRPWTPALFASELAQTESRAYFVALAHPERSPHRPLASLRPRRVVVGFAGLLLQVEEAHVTTVAVHPMHHRRKIGTHLMLALLDEARRRGVGEVTLEVRAGNHGAQRLYSAFGFVPAGVRRRYYAETGEDAVIMWLHDLQGAEMAERLARQAARVGDPGGASGAPDFPVPWVKGRVGLERES